MQTKNCLDILNLFGLVEFIRLSFRSDEVCSLRKTKINIHLLRVETTVHYNLVFLSGMDSFVDHLLLPRQRRVLFKRKDQ